MRNYFFCLNFWVKTVPGFKIKIDEIFIHYILKIWRKFTVLGILCLDICTWPLSLGFEYTGIIMSRCFGFSAQMKKVYERSMTLKCQRKYAKLSNSSDETWMYFHSAMVYLNMITSELQNFEKKTHTHKYP